MTLVQASICNDGKSIIIIGDRMVSIKRAHIEYETEANDSKIYLFHKNIIAFSGTLGDIISIKNDIDNKQQDVEKFAIDVSKKIKERIENEIEKVIKRFTLHDKDAFIKDE